MASATLRNGGLCTALLFSDHRGQTADNFFAALRKIFRHVVENLCAGVRRALGPAGSFVCCLHRVANIFSIAQRGLAQQPAVSGSDFHAVA